MRSESIPVRREHSHHIISTLISTASLKGNLTEKRAQTQMTIRCRICLDHTEPFRPPGAYCGLHWLLVLPRISIMDDNEWMSSSLSTSIGFWGLVTAMRGSKSYPPENFLVSYCGYSTSIIRTIHNVDATCVVPGVSKIQQQLINFQNRQPSRYQPCSPLFVTPLTTTKPSDIAHFRQRAAGCYSASE